MKYLVLVSHGEFAAGLKTSLMMLAGQRDDVIASGLPDGKTADEFHWFIKNFYWTRWTKSYRQWWYIWF